MIPHLNISPGICAEDFLAMDELCEYLRTIDPGEQVVQHPFTDALFFPYEEEVMPKENYKQYLIKDCKLSGCDAECAKHHSIDSQYDNFDYSSCISFEEDMQDHEEDVQPYKYTPDSDHSYALDKPNTSKNIPVPQNSILTPLCSIPTPPSSVSASDSSSESEVDVETVPSPTVLIFDTSRRNTVSQKRVKKQQQLRTQTAVSAKSLKAAIKRTKVQNIRNQQRTKHSIKTYRGRKVYNSVETTPSSSMPSSAQSSRCNSDTEDSEKREVHNNSERKRREVQRTALQTLRHTIPDLHHNPKAPKVLILNAAKTEVNTLKSRNVSLRQGKLNEYRKNKKLRAALDVLVTLFKPLI